MSLFLGLGALLVLWLGSRDVISGRLTLGEFVAFNAYLMMLSWPMIAFGWVTNMLQRGMASWKRMLEVLDAEPAIADPPPDRLVVLPEVRGAIEFRDLTFAYGGQPVLDRRLGARSTRGRRVALVGPTGSGKSTLISLLPRLFDPPPGTVFIDGVDVRDLPLAQLRGAIGFVPQEPFLFSESVADNIAFAQGGAASADRARIEWAAGVARLDKDVAAFPDGLRHDGRRARASRCRAGRSSARRSRGRSWPTRASSSSTMRCRRWTRTRKRRSCRGCGASCAQRTSIIVSHRVSTVRDADLILVLERRADRRARDARRAGARSTGSTRSCTGSSCWRRSWRRRRRRTGVRDRGEGAEADQSRRREASGVSRRA